MNDLLLVSQSEKFIEQIGSVLLELSEKIISCAQAEAAAFIEKQEFSAIIIDGKSETDSLVKFVQRVLADTGAGVVVIAGEEGEFSRRLEDLGAFTVFRPISKPILIQSVRLAMITHKRLEKIAVERERLQIKLEENRLIDRAKFVLIQYLRLSEPQAHRYIEKQAMDMRISRIEVALGILKTYES